MGPDGLWGPVQLSDFDHMRLSQPAVLPRLVGQLLSPRDSVLPHASPSPPARGSTHCPFLPPSNSWLQEPPEEARAWAEREETLTFWGRAGGLGSPRLLFWGDLRSHDFLKT